jgi:glycosyltransferase involved in cell wall biosynthesis
MKITYLGIRGIPAHYGGFETCVDVTARLLAAAGHQVTVFCRTQHFEDRPEWFAGVHLRYAHRFGPPAFHTIGHTLRSARAMRGEAIDVVHVYGVGNAPALPFLGRPGRKIVLSVDAQDWARDKWGVAARNYLLLSARLAGRLADRVVVDSRAIGDLYQARFGIPTSYIAYGADTVPAGEQGWLEKFDLHPGQYHLFVGRLTPEKRPHHLIKAYRQVRSPMPLIIVGDNPYNDDYVNQLKNLADDRVRFVGTVYDQGFHQLCHHCYLYLTASAIEGTSPALLQAMGQGAAVLVNGIPANRETIGNAGFAYQEGDLADLSRRWQELVDNPGRVQAIRPAAVRRIQEHYTWEKIAADLETLYRSI